MGIALGCIKLRLSDFLTLRPEEFEAVGKAYYAESDAHFKDNWERMRMLASISIQPHVKNRITPQSLLPLPWENQVQQTPKMTPEEQRQRMRELVERLDKNKKNHGGK